MRDRARAERGQVGVCVGVEHRPGPPGGDGRVAGEVVEVERSEHAQVVVADQARADVRL